MSKASFNWADPLLLDTQLTEEERMVSFEADEKTYQFRLFRQHRRLFASGNPDIEVPLNKKEFWKNMIFRVRVPADAKKLIFKELLENGIDRKSMMIIETEDADKIIEEVNNEMKNLS